jgi:23S rRNA pseudouridine1911/1915/1917 synthase
VNDPADAELVQDQGHVDDEDEVVAEEPSLRLVEVTAAEAGGRIDRVLAERLSDISRARLQALMAEGQVSRDGAPVRDHSAKAQPGLYRIQIPPVISATPAPESIPLTVLYEDAHLIVIDKPAGMAAHPGPGTPSGTLVNALLHYCGASLSGIGGVARPGIVHRLDKDTSGVMVAAKTDAAHQGLSALFAEHAIERVYVALTRGVPEPARATITTRIGRSPHDRKKMAVLKSGGREAITHYAVERRFGPVARPAAARVSCTLETGRTHQIRVHLASKGAPCLGDPVYGSGQPTTAVREAMARASLARQALHAAVLGFRHPLTGENLRFETPLPPDMALLESYLAEL